MALGRRTTASLQSHKKRLISPPTLTHYDPNAKIVLSADSSSYGLGSVLKQEVNNCLHPVAFASRSLTATEQRYAQIERGSVSYVGLRKV